MKFLTWRNLRTPITLLVLVAGLVFAAQWGWKNVVAPVPEPPAPSCVPQQAPTIDSSQVSIRVFNGSTRRGLARQVSNDLADMGFNVIEVGNVEQDVTTTIVLGANETNPEVQLVAGALPESTARGDGRNDGTVDVLVGSEFGSVKADAATSIEVPGDHVCLPEQTEPPVS